MAMFRRLATLLVVLGLSVGTAAPAGAIIDGSPDGDKHPYVALLFNEATSCSGSAISPTVVVTASHCLQHRTGDRFTVLFTERASDATAAERIAATGITLVDFCGFSGTCGNGLKFFASPDLAVLILDRPVTLSRYAQLPNAGAVDALPDKQRVDLAGYGVTEVISGGGPQQFFNPFNRMTAVGTLSPKNSVISNQFLAVTVKGRGSLCFGDSGSPILLGDTILGVMSFLNGQCTTAGYAFRIDRPDLLASLRAAGH